MAIRARILAAAAAALALLGGCDEVESGPVTVSAIGGQPRLVNPNLEPIDPPTAFLLEATAQGLVRFDATGQIEPALAQSWIVSDDGLRYTFRIARSAQWPDGSDVTAEPVAARLQAAPSRASRNPLKPLLGAAIAEVEAMTEDVLEFSLRAPRPNFLQLLAQPEMAVVRAGAGTGPFRAEPRQDGSLLLSVHRPDEEEEEEGHAPDVILRGEPAARAVARFDAGLADLVTGGTMNDLPIARAAEPPDDALRFDPVSGLLGLAFVEEAGPLADPQVRRALSMAIDRAGLVAAIGVPGLQPRNSIVPPAVAELPNPSAPAWTGTPLSARRAAAAAIIAGVEEAGLRIRVAMPDGPGYRLMFAHLRRDWRAIGVTAERVAETADAELRLIDAVAPANLSTWYMRRFECGANALCSAEADAELAAARTARDPAERQRRLTAADRLLMELTPFIPLTAPVRWSLVSPRLTGFQVNPFGRHFAGRLVAEPQ